jgi:hypothetical protein
MLYMINWKFIILDYYIWQSFVYISFFCPIFGFSPGVQNDVSGYETTEALHSFCVLDFHFLVNVKRDGTNT